MCVLGYCLHSPSSWHLCDTNFSNRQWAFAVPGVPSSCLLCPLLSVLFLLYHPFFTCSLLSHRCSISQEAVHISCAGMVSLRDSNMDKISLPPPPRLRAAREQSMTKPSSHVTDLPVRQLFGAHEQGMKVFTLGLEVSSLKDGEG